jgi:hypothetical protein
MVEGRGLAGIAGSAGHFDCGYEVSEVRKGNKETEAQQLTDGVREASIFPPFPTIVKNLCCIDLWYYWGYL